MVERNIAIHKTEPHFYSPESDDSTALPESPDDIFNRVSDVFAEKREVLLVTAMRQGITREAAEDAIQDAHLKLWENRNTIRPESVGGLVYTAVRNKGHDYRRYESRRPSDSLSDEGHKAIPSPTDVASEVVLSETFQEVVDSFDILSPIDAKLLILVYQDGYTFREAGEMLDQQLGTVKSKLNRAKARVRTFFDEQENA